MIRLLCTLTVVLSPFLCPGQDIFGKGYFVDIHGTKHVCYIKHEDWNLTPRISYRVDRFDSVQTIALEELKEFSVGNSLKYIRAEVNIDLSDDRPELLSYSSEPEWAREKVFLLTLVEGEVNLYYFDVEGLSRFFFSSHEGEPEQLVFKRFRTSTGRGENHSFQQTLHHKVNCADSSTVYFSTLKYGMIDLLNHFVLHNKCLGIEPIVYVDMPRQSRPEPVENNVAQAVPSIQSRTYQVSPANGRDSSWHYIGIQVNQLLQQLLSFDNTSPVNNPYVLQYAVNSRRTGRGFGVGLSYQRQAFEDDAGGLVRNTVSRTLSLRLGYERKHSLGKRWMYFYAFDILFGGTKSETEVQDGSPSNFTITTNSRIVGTGPRGGLMFRVGEQLLLGTEMTYYYRSIKSKQKITGLPDSEQKANNFELVLPAAIFLIMRLGR